MHLICAVDAFQWLFVLQGEVVGANGDDWLGDDEAPLGGFPWKGGAERETTGILMWSEPFIITQENGEQVNIVTGNENRMHCAASQYEQHTDELLSESTVSLSDQQLLIRVQQPVVIERSML